MIRLLSAAALLALALPAFADSKVPRQLVQMGRLLDGQDHPVSGEHKLKFAIYEDFRRDPTRPKQPLWEDAYTITFAADGTYAVVLGDEAAGLGHKALTLDGPGSDRFIGVSVDDGNELEPRLRIGSTAFALVAASAEKADDVACAGCVATGELADGAVTNAKLADGTIELAKLKRETSGHVAGLDSDLLDGLDSSAFAPAAIEGKIDAIHASVGDGLTTRVDGLGTKLDAVNGGLGTKLDGLGTTLGTKIDGSTSTVGGKVDAVAAKVDSVTGKLDTVAGSVGTGLSGKVDGLSTSVGAVKTNTDGLATKLDQLLSRGQYSQTCKDSWVAAAWGTTGDASGYQGCMHDGRWHLAFDTQNQGNAGTLAQLTAWVNGGASVRATTASIVAGFDCVRVETRASGRLMCMGPMHEHPNTGKGAGGSPNTFHLIALNVDTDGTQWHSAYMQNGNGSVPVAYSPSSADLNTWGRDWFAGPAATQAKWWVRF